DMDFYSPIANSLQSDINNFNGTLDQNIQQFYLAYEAEHKVPHNLQTNYSQANFVQGFAQATGVVSYSPTPSIGDSTASQSSSGQNHLDSEIEQTFANKTTTRDL